MSVRAVVPILLFVLVLAGRVVFSQAPAKAPDAPVTYTDAQAVRGGEVFSSVCLSCHARKEMSNPDFRVKWNGRTAFDLFERIRSTMPDDNPGSLPRSSYLDVTAYLAKLNNITPGNVELPDDEAALKKQILSLPPTERPRSN